MPTLAAHYKKLHSVDEYIYKALDAARSDSGGSGRADESTSMSTSVSTTVDMLTARVEQLVDRERSLTEQNGEFERRFVIFQNQIDQLERRVEDLNTAVQNNQEDQDENASAREVQPGSQRHGSIVRLLQADARLAGLIVNREDEGSEQFDGLVGFMLELADRVDLLEGRDALPRSAAYC